MTLSFKRVSEEHDACGLWAWVNRDGHASFRVVEEGIQALDQMSHRAGMIDGEGDGAGILTDIPRALWQDWLRDAGQDPGLTTHRTFGVAHFLLPSTVSPHALFLGLRDQGVNPVLIRRGATEEGALGVRARQEGLTFWQAAWTGTLSLAVLKAIWQWESLGAAILSFSHDSVVYKLRGRGGDLARYFSDLRDPRFETVSLVGHVRYSTNTTTRAERAQPFRILGHNGEINTIARLRKVACELGYALPAGASDSQDVDRFTEALMVEYGLSLLDVLSFLFPPVASLVEGFPVPEREAWRFIRQALGPVAQGPAAVIGRFGDTVAASQDALGLRPLWVLETRDGMALSSEQGVLALEVVRAPEPLGPGEKMAITVGPSGLSVLRTPTLERQVAESLGARLKRAPRAVGKYSGSLALESDKPLGSWYFEQADLELLQAAVHGQDLIGSLGFDSPLAALNPEGGPTADYLQETVAVVTNPAIDRERESVHFSTETVLGARPWFNTTGAPGLRLTTPFLIDRWEGAGPVPPDLAVLSGMEIRVVRIPCWVERAQETRAVLAAIGRQAVKAATEGAGLLVLDDDPQARGGPLDPVLAAASVARALEQEMDGPVALRRRVGILVRSGLIRRLHDAASVLGIGADAVLPYRLWEEAARVDGSEGIRNTAKVLRQGLEKVLSTMGIHELRGYGPVFSAIGLTEEVADLLEVPLMVAGGHGVEQIEEDILSHYGMEKGALRPYHLYPKLFKAAQQAAEAGDMSRYQSRLKELESMAPVSLRQLLEVVPTRHAVPQDRVNLSVGEHRLPFVIGSMSFGSQGETAYRAYLKAAHLAGIIAMNGEGGEIPDLVPRWRAHRGIQVASGRFGITGDVLATAHYLEIKIGQGAKPGEGGHLPARKVSPAVAAARHSQAGVDLISPSNNHDLYSIEDLAELIYELKVLAPDAQVAVKVPVVPNIGTIAVGIAKAGADIINLSGFEGGTGAARRHALRHVGLPSDLGTVLVHQNLVAAGLRGRVEIWADGGMRGPDDVVKMVLLGANRVGFGTLAMVAAGCTICRGCQLDTCHVGITTQVRTSEEAERHGLKRFVPRDLDIAAAHIASFFTAMGEAVREMTGALAAHRLQDLVGMASHLTQARGSDVVSLQDWLHDIPIPRLLTGVDPAVGANEENRRVIQVSQSGHRIRQATVGSLALDEELTVDIEDVAGQGLASFHGDRMVTRVRRGAQDGVAKGMSGGDVVVLGAVGKSLAYGATGGRLMVQGVADTRACIRLSGGEVVLGAWPAGHVDGSLSGSSLKGYAFEYMTGGLVVTLGDPGPWICAGMTGGVVVSLLHPDLGLDEAYLRSRLAPSAHVRLTKLGPKLWSRVDTLLRHYAAQLEEGGQTVDAARVRAALMAPERFVSLHPAHAQADPDVSTE